MSLAQTCADITTSILGTFGEVVTITRRAATAGGAATTTTASCMIQVLGATGYSQLRTEGLLNANETEAHMFLFPSGTVIAEAIDSITHQGQTYKVLMQDEYTLQGVTVLPYAIAVRV